MLVEADPLAKPAVHCHLPCQMDGAPVESWALLRGGRQGAWGDTGERGHSTGTHRKPDFITSRGTT